MKVGTTVEVVIRVKEQERGGFASLEANLGLDDYRENARFRYKEFGSSKEEKDQSKCKKSNGD